MHTRFQNLIIGISAIAAINLAGCATTYKAPTDPSLAVDVEVYKGYKTGVGFGTGTQQEYSIYTNDECDTPQRLASFTWTNGAMKNKTVSAGQALRIGAFTNYFSASGDGYWNGVAYVGGTDVQRCGSYARFTPQAGAKYKIIQSEGAGKTCSLEVIDLNTQQAPSDLLIGLRDVCPNLPKE